MQLHSLLQMALVPGVWVAPISDEQAASFDKSVVRRNLAGYQPVSTLAEQ